MSARVNLLRAGATRRSKRISRIGALIEVCFLIALIVLFNGFRQWVGYFPSAAEPERFVSVLAPEFAQPMPWLNGLWSLSLALALAKFAFARWSYPLRWADLALGVLSIVVLVRMVSGGPIVVGGGQGLTLAGALDLLGREDAWAAADAGVKLALAMAAIATALATLGKLGRLLTLREP